MDVAIAVLLLIGIILLLFTPLVSGAEYGTSFSYNLQEFHKKISELEKQLQPYVEMSIDIRQTMPDVEAISTTTMVAILFLYACALLTIVNFFRKIPRLFSAAQWIALATSAGLLVSMISAKSKIEESDLIASFFSYNVKIGFLGIILGIILIAAAMVLHFKPGLLSGAPITPNAGTSGTKWRCPNLACLRMNDAGSRVCSVCGTPRNKKSAASVVVSPSTWRCTNPSCGHINDADSRFCSVCGTGKGAVVVKPKSVWICTCGKTNDESASVCAYCHRPKNGDDSGLFKRNPEF